MPGTPLTTFDTFVYPDRDFVHVPRHVVELHPTILEERFVNLQDRTGITFLSQVVNNRDGENVHFLGGIQLIRDIYRFNTTFGINLTYVGGRNFNMRVFQFNNPELEPAEPIVYACHFRINQAMILGTQPQPIPEDVARAYLRHYPEVINMVLPNGEYEQWPLEWVSRERFWSWFRCTEWYEWCRRCELRETDRLSFWKLLDGPHGDTFRLVIGRD